MYVTYHIDANPSTPCDTKLVATATKRAALLDACALVFGEEWDDTAGYIIKQDVPHVPGLQVTITDFRGLQDNDVLHAYKKSKRKVSTTLGIQL